MRSEIDPSVLAWLDEQNIKQRRPRLTDILQGLSIKIIDEKTTLNAWAWRRPGYVTEHIVTVWAEDVEVARDGQWKTRISLDPSGDLHYNADQKERERERISILTALLKSERDCKVILMINLRSRAEEALGIAAKAQCRVLDPEVWHLDIEPGARHGALRRGPKLPGKTVTPPQQQEDLGGSMADTGPTGLRFPDQETRDRVERAAVEHATIEYASHGPVVSVESQNLGYDLQVIDGETGEIKYKVEVKGTSGKEEAFYLTRNELREARADPQRWRLAIVVDALNAPTLHSYRPHEMERQFEMASLAWYCSPKGD